MINLGVIGRPSDWLIASDVDYKKAKDIFSINLIDIDIKELIDYTNASNERCPFINFNGLFDSNEIDKAYRIYLALLSIIDKYKLEGLTVRCFDLLDTVKSTSCLAFSLLNRDGIIATCEGDIPSLISMYLIKKIYNKPSFQANPSKIMVDTNEIILAHCTLPLSMCDRYALDTHYESKTGIGVKGEMRLDDVIIFKISSDLTRYVALKGKITKNLHLNNLCRTQINIKMSDDVSYFLKRPLQNHHIIFYSSDSSELDLYMNKLGLKKIK